MEPFQVTLALQPCNKRPSSWCKVARKLLKSCLQLSELTCIHKQKKISLLWSQPCTKQRWNECNSWRRRLYRKEMGEAVRKRLLNNPNYWSWSRMPSREIASSFEIDFNALIHILKRILTESIWKDTKRLIKVLYGPAWPVLSNHATENRPPIGIHVITCIAIMSLLTKGSL